MVAEEDGFKKAIMAELNGCPAPFEAVNDALCNLDRPTQALIRMRYMREFSDHEIGLILSLDAADVARRIAEGLCRIQKKIDDAFRSSEPIREGEDENETLTG